MKNLIYSFAILILVLYSFTGSAHPMPHSRVLLNIHEKHITGEIQLPLNELQAAIGMGVNDHPQDLVARLGDTLRLYLQQHIRPKTFDGKPWLLTLGKMHVVVTHNPITGDYNELLVQFEMTPPPYNDLRNFYFDYDVIVHQVITHKIFVSVKQDWQQGLISEDSTAQEVGVIALDIPSGKVFPFQVSLQQGSWWKGFSGMLELGIVHIVEGTDHLLFILTLLLPAMLLAEKRRWTKVLSIKQSLWNLGKIITAFTVGHSVTLLLGSVQWLQFPSQPIEVLIAISILVSAFHALVPLYPSKEVWVAGSFGLIHGLAFAQTLATLHLSLQQMALSIVGFNLGIELAQLGLIVVCFPLLIACSKTPYYTILRIAMTLIMIVLALVWMLERIVYIMPQ